MSRPRAIILVTGSELIHGQIVDENGAFLARELSRVGVACKRIAIVGDDPDDLANAIAEGLQSDLCVISGGLGPTHDDRTIELLAKAAGRPLVLDSKLERKIDRVGRSIARAIGVGYHGYNEGVRKQASIPEGALVIGLAGTAPGVVLDTAGAIAIALPGPPSELQRLWPRALSSEPVQRLLRDVPPFERRVLRFYGLSESALAAALERAGGESPDVSVTICARYRELIADIHVAPNARERADEIEKALAEAGPEKLFARDERPLEEIVLTDARELGLTLATAESCTGGLLSGQLTKIAGASDVFRGSVVSYSNDAKETLLGVATETLADHGAVSAEVAAETAEGARKAFDADIAIAVTGIAGPSGGTEAKPVGLVYLCVAGPGGRLAEEHCFPGDRAIVRRFAVGAGLQLLRRFLAQSRHEPV